MNQPADLNCQIRIVRVWINAFIPRDMDGVKVVPGSGPHAGKTMLPSPGPVDAWFLTDQRDFSSGADAHSRMHSEITFDLSAGKVVKEFHRCEATIQVDEKTGEELCHEIPDRSDMGFSDVTWAEGRMTARLKASSKNPCLKLGPLKISPGLDYEGTITLTWDAARQVVGVRFEGKIETYPAFEMLATADDGPPVVVFQADIEPDATPASLAGGPQRPIDVTIDVSCG